MKQCNGTGVQQAINRAVFELLDMIVIYPVEDENPFLQQERRSASRCFPDEERINTLMTLHFRCTRILAKDFCMRLMPGQRCELRKITLLKDGDIIKIVSAAK